MKGKRSLLLKLSIMGLVTSCILWQAVKIQSQQLAHYQLVWGKFKVLDKDGRSFFNAQLRARLNPDPQSPNSPLDRVISSGNISYSTEDYDYQLLDTQTQTVNKEGEAKIPFIVYGDREDCLDYEVALFYQGKQVSQQTAIYCVSATSGLSHVFRSDQYIPLNYNELLLIWLPVFFLCLMVTLLFPYYPYYRWRIKKSYDPERAENYKSKALSLWGFINLLILIFFTLYFFPRNNYWVWGGIGVIGVICLSLLCVLFR